MKLRKISLLFLVNLFTISISTNTYAEKNTKPVIKPTVKASTKPVTKVTPKVNTDTKKNEPIKKEVQKKENVSELDEIKAEMDKLNQKIKDIQTKNKAIVKDLYSESDVKKTEANKETKDKIEPTKKEEIKVEVKKEPEKIVNDSKIDTVPLDEIDLFLYSYIQNSISYLDLLKTTNSSNCSKGIEFCNSEELINKAAETTLEEIKKKYPDNAEQFNLDKIKYLLVKSIALKDRFGEKNLEKLYEMSKKIQDFNDELFKNKKEALLKKYQENYDLRLKNKLQAEQNNTSTVQNYKGRILFVSERDGNPEIYIMNADGSNQIRLTNNNSYDLNPILSPDGKKIAFVSDRDGNPEIYVMDADGSNQTRLTADPSYDYSPTWSPDSKKIAFISNRGGASNISTSGVSKISYKIYVMNIDGSDQKIISPDSIDDESPKWSPDGAKMLFVSKRTGNPEVYVMNIDGTNTLRLTTSNYSIMPNWSPDAKKIVYRGNENGNPEIYVMTLDGSEKIKITNNLVAGETPFYSEDGTKIVFVSKRDNVLSPDGILTNEIYVMNVDGKNINRLTNNFFDDYSPSWTFK